MGNYHLFEGLVTYRNGFQFRIVYYHHGGCELQCQITWIPWDICRRESAIDCKFGQNPWSREIGDHHKIITIETIATQQLTKYNVAQITKIIPKKRYKWESAPEGHHNESSPRLENKLPKNNNDLPLRETNHPYKQSR